MWCGYSRVLPERSKGPKRIRTAIFPPDSALCIRFSLKFQLLVPKKGGQRPKMLTARCAVPTQKGTARMGRLRRRNQVAPSMPIPHDGRHGGRAGTEGGRKPRPISSSQERQRRRCVDSRDKERPKDIALVVQVADDLLNIGRHLNRPLPD